MQLSLRDAARLLQVAERNLVRAIDSGELRAQRINHQFRFHPAELLEWATARRLRVPPEFLAPPPTTGANGANGDRRGPIDEAVDAGRTPTSLSDALAAGGVHHDVAGSDRDSALKSVVELLPLPPGSDREFFLSFLLARENAGSTALGDGIAIPHVRSPLVLQGTQPLAMLCYLKQPIDFRAADGQPVHTLFSLVTGTVKSHLYLISTLAFVLQEPAVRAVLARRGRSEEVLAAVLAAELSRLDAAPAPTRGAS